MKRIITLSFVCLFLTCTVKAQNWGGGVDDNDLHFGFTFQYISSGYILLKKPDWQRTPFTDPNTGLPVSGPPSSISSPSSPGFGIGFVTDFRLGEHADARFTPTLVFSDRQLDYTYMASEPVSKKIPATMVDFPLGIKLKSDRRNNFRAYVLGGVKYSYNIGSGKKTNNESVLDIKETFVNNVKGFFSYEAGFGFDLYFEYFKMSPEIKLSHSFNDILKHEDTPYAAPVDKLMLRHVTFSLFFE